MVTKKRLLLPNFYDNPKNEEDTKNEKSSKNENNTNMNTTMNNLDNPKYEDEHRKVYDQKKIG